jgi:hypothetical protein
MKLMSKLKNESDMKEFVGIGEKYDEWIKHFLFKNVRNAGPKYIKHPQTNGKLLSDDKYISTTSCLTVLVLDELMKNVQELLKYLLEIYHLLT